MKPLMPKGVEHIPMTSTATEARFWAAQRAYMRHMHARAWGECSCSPVRFCPVGRQLEDAAEAAALALTRERAEWPE